MPRGLSPRLARSIRGQADRVLRTGSRFRSWDQIRQRHFWSTYLFQPDANGYISSGEFALFTTPPGQFGQGFPTAITELDTNWKSANRVPDNQNFEITEIGVTPTPLSSKVDAEETGVDEVIVGNILNCFLHNTLCAIQYITNTVELGYCQDFAQPGGPTMGIYQPYDDTTAADAKGVTRYSLNGFAAPGLRRRFKIPILLQHGETFSFRFLVPRSYYSGGISIGARLDFWATESFVEKS